MNEIDENGVVWRFFSKDNRQEYLDFLKLFANLTYLFKENREEGDEVPYLHYRIHEQLFGRVFNVKDITRKDTALDFVAQFDDENIGIGLKTWVNSNKNYNSQKVAEFDTLSKQYFEKYTDKLELAKEISRRRNTRIRTDEDRYGVSKSIYHYVIREPNLIRIFETKYLPINVDKIELQQGFENQLIWKDLESNTVYSWNKSKSTLMQRFDVTSGNEIISLDINMAEDPFELLKKIFDDMGLENQEDDGDLILPLYLIKQGVASVPNQSGLNKWHRHDDRRKNRTNWDVEIRIPSWVHTEFSGWFFGRNFTEDDSKLTFTLRFPNGRETKASINGSGGKNMQSARSKVLGQWLLKSVFGKEDSWMKNPNNDDVITFEELHLRGVDSIRLSKVRGIDDTISIDVASLGAFNDMAKRLHREYVEYDAEGYHVESPD